MNEIHHSRPWIDETDQEAVRRILAEGMIAEGTRVRAFEEAVTEYVGCTSAVAASSGTAGLALALAALEMPAGSEVILPTYTCPAVLKAVRAVDAVPVLCDVGEHWNMTPETAERQLSPRTGAVIVVSTFGINNPPGPYRELGVPIIEDCCQNFRPRVGKDDTETGDLQVYSFHGTKCLTTGEGGMVTTRRDDLLRAMKAKTADAQAGSRFHGARMSDLQAALGLSQLVRYDRFLARRKALAEHYFAALASRTFQLPNGIQDSSIFFRFPLLWPGNYDRWKDLFFHQGIHVRKGVDTLLHRVLGLSGREYPMAERLFAETVSIPIYPALVDEDRDRIVEACCELSEGR